MRSRITKITTSATAVLAMMVTGSAIASAGDVDQVEPGTASSVEVVDAPPSPANHATCRISRPPTRSPGKRPHRRPSTFR